MPYRGCSKSPGGARGPPRRCPPGCRTRTSRSARSARRGNSRPLRRPGTESRNGQRGSRFATRRGTLFSLMFRKLDRRAASVNGHRAEKWTGSKRSRSGRPLGRQLEPCRWARSSAAFPACGASAFPSPFVRLSRWKCTNLDPALTSERRHSSHVMAFPDRKPFFFHGRRGPVVTGQNEVMLHNAFSPFPHEPSLRVRGHGSHPGPSSRRSRRHRPAPRSRRRGIPDAPFRAEIVPGRRAPSFSRTSSSGGRKIGMLSPSKKLRSSSATRSSRPGCARHLRPGDRLRLERRRWRPRRRFFRAASESRWAESLAAHLRSRPTP